MLRGKVEDGSWSAFYLADGQLKAALGVNRYRDVSAARRLIANQVPVTPEQLADEAVDLKHLRQSVANPV